MRRCMYGLLVLALAVAGCKSSSTSGGSSGSSSFGSVTIPLKASPSDIVAQKGCAVDVCTATLYRMSGSCPADVSSSTGWQALATASGTAQWTFTDGTVQTGMTYSYDVELSPEGTHSFSGPSNCQSITVSSTPPVL